MQITRSSIDTQKGPADWFTGAVRIDPLFQASDPARVAGAAAGGFLSVPELAVPLFAVAGAIAGAAAGMLFCFTR